MDQLIKYVLGEIRIIRGAPLTFSIALSVLLVGVWSATDWRFAKIIESKDGIIALYMRRLVQLERMTVAPA
jgi:hypothetical protein